MLPSEHVGARIRLYRTQQRMTLDDLARSISKSASTLSKYESGKIAIDVNTVCEIAAVLRVSVGQLMDFPPARQGEDSGQGGFFAHTGLYWAYTCLHGKQAVLSALEILPVPDGGEQVFLYYGVQEATHYTKADFLYQGKLCRSDSGTAFYMQNPCNRGDMGYIYVRSMFSAQNTTTGVFVFLRERTHVPAVAKILFSRRLLGPDDGQLQELRLTDKTTLSLLKKENMLSFY